MLTSYGTNDMASVDMVERKRFNNDPAKRQSWLTSAPAAGVTSHHQHLIGLQLMCTDQPPLFASLPGKESNLTKVSNAVGSRDRLIERGRWVVIAPVRGRYDRRRKKMATAKSHKPDHWIWRRWDWIRGRAVCCLEDYGGKGADGR